jgi:hypothetical protein
MIMVLLAASLGVACKEEPKRKDQRSLAPAIEKVERQPVVGRAPFELYMIDKDGKDWLIQDHRLVEDVQRKLDARGFDVKADGKSDLETATALRKFQQKHDLEQSGKIDHATARALGLDWDRFARERAKRLP